MLVFYFCLKCGPTVFSIYSCVVVNVSTFVAFISTLCQFLFCLSQSTLFTAYSFFFRLVLAVIDFKIQWKPLNVITLGQRETDIINRLITWTKQALRLIDWKNAKWASNNFELIDHINQMIALTMITLCGFYCTS